MDYTVITQSVRANANGKRDMSTKFLIVWLAVVVLAVFVGAKLFRQPEPAAANKDAQRLTQALKEASRFGNNIVNARSAMENPFSASVYDGNEWHPLLSDRQAVAMGTANISVVFAHGYNTSFAEAIGRGNELCGRLESIIGKTNFNKIKFYTFCWRGDLGLTAFGAADESASNTAPVFAIFLSQVAGAGSSPEPRKLILVTHSLGARVSLEALRRMLSR